MYEKGKPISKRERRETEERERERDRCNVVKLSFRILSRAK